MRPPVERRFEVRGHDAVDATAKLVKAAGHGGTLQCTLTGVDRPRLLDVRLKGAMGAVREVTDRVRAIPAASILRDLPSVAGATPIYPDPNLLLRVGVEPGGRVWDGVARPTDRPVTVAIVDSGLMTDHPDLRDHVGAVVEGRVVRGVRCIGGQQLDDVTDEDGHGTMLAGSILTGAGGCRAVRLVAVKFFDASVLPSTANADSAIRCATEMGADVINLSWDVGLGSPRLGEAIEYACARGALVVIAAGNDGSDNDSAPAVPARYASVCPAQVLTVMATDRYDERAWFSNYGSRTVDLAAPGVRVVTTRAFLSHGGQEGARRYHRHSGTSAAAALVSGAAALLKASVPHLSPADLKQCLVSSVDRLPRLACASRGRLNIPAALQCAVATGISQGGPPA